ncbi:MAG: FAD-binding protein [Alphaproteobacteria bacterium]
MTVLVLAEHDTQAVKASIPCAVTAARKVAGGGEVDLLLLTTPQHQNVATSAAAIEGVARVRLATHDNFDHLLAEGIAPPLAKLATEGTEGTGYDAIIAPVGSLAKTIIPRLAALLDVQPITEVLAVFEPDCFLRPLYAGNALAKVKSSDAKRLITIRATAFDPAPNRADTATPAPIEPLELSPSDQSLSTWQADEVSQSARPELTSAKIVISGGRGMQSGESFQLLEAVADKLGAALGASRAAVDAGFVPNEFQVGQTGKVVAPDLYIAVGISGAIQHLAGMKDSKIIVAINNDEDAPIFQVADYGLVEDLFTALPQLEKLL